MAQLHTDSVVLAQDVVAMFLNDMNALECTLLDVNESRSQASQAAEPKKRKTTCARQRDRLLAIRSEAASLQHQLRILHDNHDLREALDLLTSCSSDEDWKRWKFRAMRERSRTQQAEQQNIRLRQRVAANAKFLRQVANLVNKQARGGGNQPFVNLSDVSTRVFSALRARLDARWDQVATIRPQCDNAISAIVSASRVAKGSWATSSSAHEIRMVFDDSFAAPFDSTLVCGVVSRFTLLHGVEVLTERVTFAVEFTLSETLLLTLLLVPWPVCGQDGAVLGAESDAAARWRLQWDRIQSTSDLAAHPRCSWYHVAVGGIGVLADQPRAGPASCFGRQWVGIYCSPKPRSEHLSIRRLRADLRTGRSTNGPHEQDGDCGHSSHKVPQRAHGEPVHGLVSPRSAAAVKAIFHNEVQWCSDRSQKLRLNCLLHVQTAQTQIRMRWSPAEPSANCPWWRSSVKRQRDRVQAVRDTVAGSFKLCTTKRTPKQHAEEHNSLLRLRVAKNAKFLKQIIVLVRKQASKYDVSFQERELPRRLLASLLHAADSTQCANQSTGRNQNTSDSNPMDDGSYLTMECV